MESPARTSCPRKGEILLVDDPVIYSLVGFLFGAVYGVIFGYIVDYLDR